MYLLKHSLPVIIYLDRDVLYKLHRIFPSQIAKAYFLPANIRVTTAFKLLTDFIVE